MEEKNGELESVPIGLDRCAMGDLGALNPCDIRRSDDDAL